MKEEKLKPRLFFVDQDQNILDALKRNFRSHRPIWDMHFISNNRKVIELMLEAPANIIVIDSRGGGCALFGILKDKFPETMRVLLSGGTESELSVEVLRTANQFLAKPCTTEEIQATLADLLEIQGQLGSGQLRKKIMKLDSLPTIPDYYWELKKAVENPDSSASDIAALLSKDVAITAKVLQLANSSFFGRAATISNLGQAISRLGFDLVTRVILAAFVFQVDAKSVSPSFSIGALWEHSLKVSRLAHTIANEEQQSSDIVDTCALAGLLHDIGKVVLALCLPEEYEKYLQAATGDQKTNLEMEKKMVGTNHTVVGEYLARLWGLPKETGYLIGNHHNIQEIESERGAKGFSPLSVIHVADTLVHQGEMARDYDTCMSFLNSHGLSSRLSLWTAIKESLTGPCAAG